jgi:UDP-glucuronate 4-epimerase
MATILVTGAAGFIGYHLTQRLLADGHNVVGLDNLNPYYDISLKEARLARLLGRPGFDFVKLDLAERPGMEALFLANKFDRVIHLAAQAGVRYSLTNPHIYIHSNIVGFINLLEGCRNSKVEHLVFASSSSVYGSNTHMPFSESDPTDHPLSLYAATKKASELMAHSYSHLHQLPATGLRFFTVYGPWGRPDMAMFLFTKAIIQGESIDVFNNGHHKRDFTYIDDIVEGVVRVMDHVPAADPDWSPASPNPASSNVPYRIYNIGNNRPVEVMYLIKLLEGAIGRKATMKMLPLQPGDVEETYANVDDLAAAVRFRPRTSIEEGVRRFLQWYKEYYRV